MKKYILLFLLLFSLLNAQNQRVTYEYRAIPDSTNRDNVERELMILDVNPKGSEFYSFARAKSDSIFAVEFEKNIHSESDSFDESQIYTGKITYAISKKYPGFETFMHTTVGFDDYKVSDKRKPNWKILPEKQKISEFDTQKAETEMYGRKWTAWFAPEIPIHDGPYKFHGLPGLIVKLEDQTKSHIFELKGLKKYVGDRKSKIENQFSYAQEISIDYPRYKKLFQEHYKDPAKSIREMFSQEVTTKIADEDGREISVNEIVKQQEKEAREELRQNNNPLELDLVK